MSDSNSKITDMCQIGANQYCDTWQLPANSYFT